MDRRLVVSLLAAGLAHAGFLAPRPAPAQPREGGKGGDAAGAPADSSGAGSSRRLVPPKPGTGEGASSEGAKADSSRHSSEGAKAEAPSHPAPPSPAAPPTEDVRRMKEQTALIQDLIQALGNSSAGVRDAAARRLREMGAAALPYVEEFLRKKGALETARILGRLQEQQGAPPDAAQLKEAEGRLPKADQAARDARSPAAAERYVYRKYNEAVGYYHLKEFERALALAQALMVLEPQSPLKPRLHELKILCDREITKRRIVAAAILPLKSEYRIGDEIDFRIRIENVSPAEVRMAFGGGAVNATGAFDAASARPIAVGAKVFVTMHDPLGLTRQVQRSVDWTLPSRIAVAPGLRWEQRLVVGTKEDDDIMDPLLARTYEVELLLFPRFWVGENPEVRRISFDTQPAVAFPAGVKWRAADPLACLGATLDDTKSTLNELFMAALRVPRTDADKGAALLVKGLPRFTGPAQDVIMVALRNLTGQAFGFDVAKWLEWGGVKAAPPKAAAARPTTEDAKPSEAAGETRTDLLNLVKLYLAARKEEDAEVLESVMLFPHEPDRESFRRCVKNAWVAADPVDIARPVYVVEAPARGASGDYLFLVPLRNGYASRRLMLLDSKEGFRVAYTPDEFPPREEDLAAPLTALDAPPEVGGRVRDRWKALTGAELAIAAQALKRKLQDDIQALDFARKNGLTVAPGVGSLDERTKLWESIKGLPPERVREKLLAWHGASLPVPPR